MNGLIVALLLAVSGEGATCPLPARSQNAVREFRRMNPCPLTGKTSGACPGWEVDHIVPLACCGKDHWSNMRWLEKDLHKLRHVKGLQCEIYNKNQ